MPFTFPTPQQNAAWNALDLNGRLAFLNYVGAGARADEAIKDWVREHYGAMGAYLDHPEIGPLLLRSAKEGWAPERLQAELGATQFWKTTSASQREWDLLNTTDPASAKAKVDQLKAQINTLLGQQGVAEQFTDQRVTDLATQLLRNGAQADQIPKAVLAEVGYSPTMAAGKLGDTMNTVGAKAEQFVVPISDQAKFEWAKKIEMGTATQEGLDDYLRQVAKGQYATLAEGIDRGFTVKQLLDPQIQQTAQLLEVDPETIDLRDPKWAQIIQYNDGQTTRLATLSEAAKLVKSTADYRQTATANREAATLAENLAKTFGAV